MIYLILGAVVLLVLVTAGRRGRPVRFRREWRFLPAVGALAAFVAAGVLVVREAWVVAIPMVIFGLGLVTAARVNPRRAAAPPSNERGMSEAEACSILGVDPGAGPQEIQAAYRRLMERVHPDKGGASGLAAQLNAARDRLLKP